MLIDLYVIHYNEERCVKYVSEYWKRLPLRKIFVIDNLSTDSSVSYIQKNFDNVEIIINPAKEFNDRLNRDIKNNIWKQSRGKCDFCLVSDFDEVIYHPDITGELNRLKSIECTVARMSSLCTICRDGDLDDFAGGLIHEHPKLRFYHHHDYDKRILFDPNAISETFYIEGAHECYMQGQVKECDSDIRIFHINNLGESYINNKNKAINPRRCELNKRMLWSVHFEKTPAEVHEDFEQKYAQSKSYAEYF